MIIFILIFVKIECVVKFVEKIYVRTRFATNHSSVGLAREKAQTISFVEHEFERLGLGHQAVGFS